jgi:hypothetical protein
MGGSASSLAACPAASRSGAADGVTTPTPPASGKFSADWAQALPASNDRSKLHDRSAEGRAVELATRRTGRSAGTRMNGCYPHWSCICSSGHLPSLTTDSFLAPHFAVKP